MTAIPPMAYNWDGESLIPRVPRLADRHLVVGETYMMVPHEDRSDVTHKHEFAWLRDAWMNLPEDIAVNYPTTEHLRKRALIEAGYYDETIVDAGTKAAALRVASWAKAQDDFALVFVRDQFVIKRTAKSQSRRAMKKAEFQDSKQKIMEIISAMIGVDPKDLAANVGKAA
jgi:hypothetical protein